MLFEVLAAQYRLQEKQSQAFCEVAGVVVHLINQKFEILGVGLENQTEL